MIQQTFKHSTRIYNCSTVNNVLYINSKLAFITQHTLLFRLIISLHDISLSFSVKQDNSVMLSVNMTENQTGILTHLMVHRGS